MERLDKSYLDILYGMRASIIDQQNKQKQTKAFDGSPGSCHYEIHQMQVVEVDGKLEMIDSLISSYLLIHS